MLGERHGLEISQRSLARHFKNLDLHRRQDDVDRGLVTLDQVAEHIRTSKRRPDGKLAGYRCVQNILRHQNDVVVHRLLFLHLWVPMIQTSLNQWMHDYNSYSKRFDEKTQLPTGCSPDVCYHAPVANKGVEGLIPIPAGVVDDLQAQYYPNANELMMTSPPWLAEFVTATQTELNIVPTRIDMDNIWPTFHRILAFMRAYDQNLLGTAPGVPRPPTNFEQAKISIENRFGRVPHGN
ncbi:uncharacterized protein MELLADRAFT_70319 [Melampsora larici-populina 98AG31]|uniref:Uncharacterized protein n=1 Tax=Melampsora larici-populina (strain 98AG31 / pathotype 3-4-7) TaxID=747676 RepID=F4SEH5_MELLP|nr:uncharacterized protein MELLADRAFT_70319 [Melampsora larici-populina 98AG31]EGF96950.1 hypothetical protein MELLADRAFT_70319 [Melampsora larici-populina 98AG31]